MSTRANVRLVAFGLLLGGVMASLVLADDCTGMCVAVNKACTLDKVVPCDPEGFIKDRAGKKIGCSPKHTLKKIHSDFFECKCVDPVDPRILSMCVHDLVVDGPDEFGAFECYFREEPCTTWYTCGLLADVYGRLTCQQTFATRTYDALVYVTLPCP